MTIWCPQCNGLHFYHDKVSEVGEPGILPEEIVVKDHMKCKNRNCNYEFNIEWFAYVRDEWLRQFSEPKRTKRMQRS